MASPSYSPRGSQGSLSDGELEIASQSSDGTFKLSKRNTLFNERAKRNNSPCLEIEHQHSSMTQDHGSMDGSHGTATPESQSYERVPVPRLVPHSRAANSDKKAETPHEAASADVPTFTAKAEHKSNSKPNTKTKTVTVTPSTMSTSSSTDNVELARSASSPVNNLVYHHGAVSGKSSKSGTNVSTASSATNAQNASAKATSPPSANERSPSLSYDDIAQAVDNPTPQLDNPGTHLLGTNGDMYILVMVGLPARGKTYIARRIRQYLTFFHSTPCELFNVGNYRRKTVGAECTHEFFDHTNEEYTMQRNKCAEDAMSDLIKWFTFKPHGQTSKVAIYDATNTTRERRAWVMRQLSPHIESDRQVIFIESICDDTVSEANKKIIEKNIQQAKVSMPDYKTMTETKAIEDFKLRIEHYKQVYETIDPNNEQDLDLTWIKLIDGGRQVTMNHIRGFLPGKIVQFLMNLTLSSRPIYLTRHGESEYNTLGKIGGDSHLSEEGEKYAVELAKYVHKELLHLNEDGSFKSVDEVWSSLKNENKLDTAEEIGMNGNGNGGNSKEVRIAPHVRLFTSSLLRTQETAKYIVHHKCADGWIIMRKKVWKALDEIYAGVFDGMTYEEIKTKAPTEFEQRQKNKLSYRYPRGESYLDVVQRLDPVIHEIERLRDPVLIVAHQGILRIIYSYFMGFNLEDAPFVSIPLNTVIKLAPGAYFCSEERIKLLKRSGTSSKSQEEPPSH